MSKLRLGIGFEGIIHPAAFAGEPAAIRPERPIAGAIRFLVDAQPHFEIKIYPLRPAKGRAAAIQGWLLVETYRFFKAERVSDVSEHVNALIDAIAITEYRAEADVTLELASVGHRPGYWPGIAELLDAGGRLAALERQAA
jgi:hypothetical protein